MQAITVRDRDAGVGGLSLTEVPHPHAAENDVIVKVHAGGFTPGELDWPSTWVDRAGRDRTPSVPGHELSGVVVELGYGTTGLTVGQRVFELTDWTEDAGEVDVVFDVIGGEILDRSAALVRAGGTLVTIARVPTVLPKEGRAIFFVVEPDRSRLADLAERLRDGRLKPIVGSVRPLAEAPAAFAPDRRTPGKMIILITEAS